jgi:hypothetical protein
MIAQDIANKLSACIPLYTSGFSAGVTITAIAVTGSTATATTDTPHGLSNGQAAAINGVEAPAQIDTASFLRTGSTATFETLQDHDLTLSERDKANGGKTITISGATEAEFNGTFTLLRVFNRRKLMIAVADSGPTAITGSPLVDNANGNIFNGYQVAANVTATTFEYTLPVTYPLDAVVTNANLQTSIRIISVLDIQQYLNDIYTKKPLDDDMLVIQLGDVTQSKKRNEQTDAASSSNGNDSFTPVLIQSFAIYIIQNVTDDLTGSEARDKVESEYIPAIFKSILRAKFDTGFTVSTSNSTFTGHGVYAFAGQAGKNKAIYVHELTFEQLAHLNYADMVPQGDTVAMRDVDYTLTTDLGTGVLTASVDLDEEPL